MVTSYYPALKDAVVLEGSLRSVLASFWPDPFGFKLNVVPVASLLVYLEVIQGSKRTIGDLMDTLFKAKQEGGVEPQGVFIEYKDDIFQLQKVGGWWALIPLFPRPEINFVLFAAVKAASGSIKELVIVRGRNFREKLKLKWRVCEPEDPSLKDCELVPTKALEELGIAYLTSSPESLAVVFGTSATRLAGKVVSIQWIRNLVEYGSPLEFVVPSISLPGTETTDSELPDASHVQDSTNKAVPVMHLPPSSQAQQGSTSSAPEVQDYGATSPSNEVYPAVDWEFLIFISHAGPIKPFAADLKNELARLDLKAFLDVHDLHPGDDADCKMERCARTSPIGLVLLSREFLDRKWPMRELKLIVKADTLLPVIVGMSHTEFKNTWRAKQGASDFDEELFEKVTRTTCIVDNGVWN